MKHRSSSQSRPKNRALSACSPKPTLQKRELLSEKQAHSLGAIFKVLGNATRLRMLHALVRADELSVTALADSLGMKPQAVSNQLQQLSARRIVEPRRDGNQIFYRIVDPCVISLLDRGLCLTEDTAEQENG